MHKGFYKDLAGQTFGNLVVLNYSFTRNQQTFWRVRCGCGVEKDVQGRTLTQGVKSCGCLNGKYIKEAKGKSHKRLTGSIWCRIRHNAKARNIPVAITQQYAADVFEIQNGECALTGIKLFLDVPITKVTASLDRIDSSKGYEEGNVQWIHKDINKMKNTFPESIFLDWIKKIHKYKNLA